MIELVIFDMDGLMFDTGRLAYRSYLEAAKKFDLELNPDVYYHLTGRTEQGIRDELSTLYGNDYPTNTWRDYINKTKQEILHKEKRVYKKEGLLELLMYLTENNYLIGLASSTKKKIILEYLEYENLPNVFNSIVGGDEIINGKPNPEIFLKTCSKLGIKPENALVLEDSLVGIEAAIEASIPTILIEDNIYDMPNHEGRNKIQIDLPVKKRSIPVSVVQLKNLLEVRQYLELNE